MHTLEGPLFVFVESPHIVLLLPNQVLLGLINGILYLLSLIHDLLRALFVVKVLSFASLEHLHLTSRFLVGESGPVLGLCRRLLPVICVFARPFLVLFLVDHRDELGLSQRRINPSFDLLLIPGQLGDSCFDGVLLMLLDLKFDGSLQAISYRLTCVEFG